MQTCEMLDIYIPHVFELLLNILRVHKHSQTMALLLFPQQALKMCLPISSFCKGTVSILL